MKSTKKYQKGTCENGKRKQTQKKSLKNKTNTNVSRIITLSFHNILPRRTDNSNGERHTDKQPYDRIRNICDNHYEYYSYSGIPSRNGFNAETL